MRSPPETPPDHARSGALAGGLACILWGLVPLYWKPLAAVDPVELIAHRHVWSLVLLMLLVLGRPGGLQEVGKALSSVRSIARLALCSVLLTTNWLVYVWGVNHGQIIETSLGYFLLPLISVLAGRFILHEQLRRMQWIAVGVAAAGVALMIFQAGRLPWIALALAGSWGCYSILRKLSPLGPIPGLAVETLLLAPLAIGFLLWRHHDGTGALTRVDLRTHLLLLSAGIVTAVPLLLFAHAARRIRLSTLGLLGYLSPTLQLILGVWVYHESFTATRMTSFAFIWIALILYTADNLL